MTRNDPVTSHAVMAYIDARYAKDFGELHYRTCVQEALRANSAEVGCQIADSIAVKLREVRQRFLGCRNLRASL